MNVPSKYPEDVEIVPSHQSARFASERQEKRGLR